jgi:hypothetical protein
MLYDGMVMVLVTGTSSRYSSIIIIIEMMEMMEMINEGPKSCPLRMNMYCMNRPYSYIGVKICGRKERYWGCSGRGVR